MTEYKSVTVGTAQSWAAAKGSIDTETLDKVLNSMAANGWKLHSIEDLSHASGSNFLLCIFERDVA